MVRYFFWAERSYPFSVNKFSISRQNFPAEFATFFILILLIIFEKIGKQKIHKKSLLGKFIHRQNLVAHFSQIENKKIVTKVK